ncbi:MAG: pantetheine-phosphate adenylyltransferase [Rhodothermales bacterium]|nr:pantetheine-phosphate adenylyltransferase [Rhodothermales bacterium]
MTQQTGGLALYPGTFDPFTYGHLDIVERASRLFDRVEVTLATNTRKKPLLDPDTRVGLIRECVGHLDNVSVAAFEGLLVEYAERRGAIALVRGLRQVSDFDSEFRMAFANRRLKPDIDTVFLMTSEQHALISSTIVREIHYWGGDTSSFVPDPVHEALRRLNS